MENFYAKKEVKKYCIKNENPNYDLHHFDTPFRALVVAPSGSGKSNFITNLISLFCKGKDGTYDNIYIFCKSRDKPLYRYLADKSKGLIEVHEDLSKLPVMNDLNQCKQTLIIFDDFVTSVKQAPIIQEWFIRGRKRSCSVMYLSQSYYGTPKLIRQNVNYVVVLKLGGSRDINALMREVSIGLTKDELMNIYNDATKNKFDVLIVNLDKNQNERYRKNFLEYYILE
jgi:hypothetical protein